MIDSMFQEGTDATLADQVARPRITPPEAPEVSLTGLGLAAPRGLGAGVAKSLAFGAEVAGAFGQTMRALDKATPEQRRVNDRQGLPAPDMSNEVGDSLRTRAAEILPDPKTAHASEQIVAGLADFATRAVGYTIALGPLAPFAMGGDAALEESDRLKHMGVDKDTRTKAGAVAGVLNAAAVAVPMTGPTALARFGKGAAAGVGTVVGQSAAEREILRAAGYDKQAESFDPFDPVALALGVVPGVLGARFGKPAGKLRTEADVRAAAQFTRAEQAKSDAFERSPENIRMLEDAIKLEKRPEVRTELQAELAKQQRAQAEHGVARAVEAEPDLPAGARVGQVVDALESNRLTPDADLAGRNAHLSAVEMAADQMGRGEAVEVEQVVQPRPAPDVALHGSNAVFDQFQLMPGRNPALFFSIENGRKTQAEHIADGPFGGQLYRVEIERGKRFDPYNDPEAARIFRELFPQREVKQIEYPDIHVDSPLIQAMREHGYNRVRVYEPSVHGFSEAITDPSLARIVARKEKGGSWQEVARETPRTEQAAAAVDQLRAARTPPESTPTRQQATPKAERPKQEPPKAKPEGDTQPTGSIDRAAADAAALDPDMLVQLEGMDAPMRVGDLLEKVKEEARQDTLMGKLVEVAAACDLTA